MNIHLHISQKAVEVDGAYHVECIITEAALEEIEVLNEHKVSYHFKEFKKALQKATEKTAAVAIPPPKPYVSPVTESLDRTAKMHEADATDSPF